MFLDSRLSSGLSSTASEQSLRIWSALIVLGALVIAAVFADLGGLDTRVENFYFDSARQLFPYRDQMLFSAVLHDGLRKLMVFVLLLLLFFVGLLRLRPRWALRLPDFWSQVRLLPYLTAVFVSGPLLVGALKQVTTRACPWSLAQYGGALPYGDFLHAQFFSLAAAGHCFPGAHASAGFVLFAFVPLVKQRWRATLAVLVFLLGLGMGWVQMMRGAHFLSHNLWSAVIGWSVMLLWYAVLKPGCLPSHTVSHTRHEDLLPEVSGV
ncbi:MAG: phosphatase PAP2 family protein [Moraxellaceae bacterium]